jgi:hypothetical protein
MTFLLAGQASDALVISAAVRIRIQPTRSKSQRRSKYPASKMALCTSVTDPRAILGSPEVPLDLHVRIMLGRRRNVWANKHRASGYEGSLFGAAQFCTTSGVSGCGGSRPISTAILITQNGRATKAGINSIARTGNAVKIPSAPSAQQTASAIPP